MFFLSGDDHRQNYDRPNPCDDHDKENRPPPLGFQNRPPVGRRPEAVGAGGGATLGRSTSESANANATPEHRSKSSLVLHAERQQKPAIMKKPPWRPTGNGVSAVKTRRSVTFSESSQQPVNQNGNQPPRNGAFRGQQQRVIHPPSSGPAHFIPIRTNPSAIFQCVPGYGR